MKKTTMAVLLSATLSTQSAASGFPVVDIANFAQMLIQYGTLAKELEGTELGNALSNAQLLQLLEIYDQTMVEYQMALRQATSLQRKLQNKDYIGLYKEADALYQDYYLDGGDAPQTQDTHQRYTSSYSQSDIESLAQSTLGYVPDTLHHNYNHAQDVDRYSAQRLQFRSRSEEQWERIQQVDQMRTGLGDQSELATLQLMVDQLQIAIEQLAANNDMRLTEMDYSNSMVNQANKNVFSANARQLENAKQAARQGITINEQPIR